LTTPEKTAGARPSDAHPAEVLAALEEAYAQIKQVSRELRPSDRIVADLGMDSLATVEILLTLEQRFGVSLVDHPRTSTVVTVGDLAALLADLRAEAAS
jgi:acyl carrier protein